MAATPTSKPTLERGQLDLFGVIMPGLAQVAPAFNLFFTTGVMVALAGASAPSSSASTSCRTCWATRTWGHHPGRHHPVRRAGGRPGDRRAAVRRADHRRALRVRGHPAARAEPDHPVPRRGERPVRDAVPAANTQTSRVIFAGARGGLWSSALAGISPRFRTPAAAAVAFVAPSIAIGVISTAFTDPGTASGFLGTYGILGLILMYLLANLALIVEWAKFRRNGIRKNPWLWVVTPVIGIIVLAIPVYGDLRPGQPSPYNALPWLTLALVAVGVAYAVFLGATRPATLASAPALLEGDESLATDPLPVGPPGRRAG
jgi:hypothetical protein